MATLVLRKLDRLIDDLLLLLIIGGGMIIHTLTCLTIRSYYGDLWGYVSFFLPGAAEAYLVFIQFGDNMYNYLILLSIFAATSLALTLTFFFKKFVRSKIVTILDKNVSPSPLSSTQSVSLTE